MQEIAFEAVYAAHAQSVRRLLQRLGVRPDDLDDVVQDTFVAVHRRLPEFEGRAAMQTWLHAICWRVAAAYHRRSRRGRELVAELAGATDEPAGAAPLLGDLHGTLDELEPAARDLLALAEIGGLSLDELAQLTGLSRGSVRRRVVGARQALEQGFERAVVRPRAVELAAPALSSAALAYGPGAHERSGYEYDAPDYCFSRLGDTLLARWRGPCTLAAHAILLDMMIRLADETPGGIAYLCLVEPTLAPPERAVRQDVGRMVARMRGRLNAAAFITHSPGLFRFMPPIINACVFLSRTELRVRFFNQEHAGMAWLVQHTARSTTPADLLARAAQMRARLDLLAPV